MGTIKTGFWKTQFIIIPTQFEQFLIACDTNGIIFNFRDAKNTSCEKEKVFADYQEFYDYVFSIDKPDYLIKSFAYSLSFRNDKNIIGFSFTTNEIRFPYLRKYANDKIPFLELCYQKGVSVDKEDGKEKYFVYEDINLYQPIVYEIFEELLRIIKNDTFALKFKSIVIDKQEETKTNVRFSKETKTDLTKSWIFKKYDLELT